MTSASASELGGYRVVRRGADGDRETYLATDEQGRQVVVALLDVTPADRSQIEGEVERCQRLDHPAVGRVLDTFDHQGRLGVAVEHHAGVTLASLLTHLQSEGERIADGAALYIANAVLEALGAAQRLPPTLQHHSPLVHQQLGPEQVLVTWDAAVKVYGFGLSAAYRAARELHALEPAELAFVPPELRDGGVRKGLSNTFAAAALLWSLLTQQMPPSAGEPLPSLAKLRGDLDRELVAAVDRAASPRSSDRFLGGRQLTRVVAGRVSAGDREELGWNMEVLRALLVVDDLACAAALPPSYLTPEAAARASQATAAAAAAAAAPASVPSGPVSVPGAEESAPGEPVPSSLADGPASGPLEWSEQESTRQWAQSTDGSVEDIIARGGQQVLAPAGEPAGAPPPGAGAAQDAAEELDTVIAPRPSIPEEVLGSGAPAASASDGARLPAAQLASPQGPLPAPAGGGLSLRAALAAMLLTAAAAFGAGVVVGRRTAPRPRSMPAASSGPAAVAPGRQSAAGGATTGAGSAPPAQAPPTAGVNASANGPASASAAAPSASGTAADPSALPATMGYVVVGPARPGAAVYDSGRRLGPSGERLRLPCGVRFLRLGTDPLGKWLGPGRGVSVACQRLTEVKLATTP